MMATEGLEMVVMIPVESKKDGAVLQGSNRPPVTGVATALCLDKSNAMTGTLQGEMAAIPIAE